MAQCAWAALVEDTETYARSVKHFRYESFATPQDAALALERIIYPAYHVLEATTDVYKFKRQGIA